MYGADMICKGCRVGEHTKCKGKGKGKTWCTCQHRKPVTVPLYSERVAASIKLGSLAAIVLNADVLSGVDC